MSDDPRCQWSGDIYEAGRMLARRSRAEQELPPKVLLCAPDNTDSLRIEPSPSNSPRGNVDSFDGDKALPPIQR